MIGDSRNFIERADKHRRNRRIFRRAKYAPAELVNGDRGVMFTIDGYMVIFSESEIFEFTNKLVDALESGTNGNG